MGKSQVAASYLTQEGDWDFDSPEVTEVIEVFCFLVDGSMSLPVVKSEVEGVLVASLGFEDTEAQTQN